MRRAKRRGRASRHDPGEVRDVEDREADGAEHRGEGSEEVGAHGDPHASRGTAPSVRRDTSSCAAAPGTVDPSRQRATVLSRTPTTKARRAARPRSDAHHVSSAEAPRDLSMLGL